MANETIDKLKNAGYITVTDDSQGIANKVGIPEAFPYEYMKMFDSLSYNIKSEDIPTYSTKYIKLGETFNPNSLNLNNILIYKNTKDKIAFSRISSNKALQCDANISVVGNAYVNFMFALTEYTEGDLKLFSGDIYIQISSYGGNIQEGVVSINNIVRL